MWLWTVTACASILIQKNVGEHLFNSINRHLALSRQQGENQWSVANKRPLYYSEDVISILRTYRTSTEAGWSITKDFARVLSCLEVARTNSPLYIYLKSKLLDPCEETKGRNGSVCMCLYLRSVPDDLRRSLPRVGYVRWFTHHFLWWEITPSCFRVLVDVEENPHLNPGVYRCMNHKWTFPHLLVPWCILLHGSAKPGNGVCHKFRQ